MEEVVRDDLLVDVVFWSPFFEYAQRFGEMFVQCHGFVPQLANEQVLLLDFLLEG
jgi:hypothetical protein